jgi:hypothetical protein
VDSKDTSENYECQYLLVVFIVKYFLMQLTEETARALLREIRIVKELLRPKTQQWVKIGVMKEKTTLGTGYKMQQAVFRGQVRRKKDKTGIWYDLNSVAPHLLKKDQSEIIIN